MAFNPFHRFRKHQRVILAVVTILLMVTFGLTWGAGDITRYFGVAGSTTSGPHVVTFKYSSSTFSTQTKVFENDVQTEIRRRHLANDFTSTVVFNILLAEVGKLSGFDKNKIDVSKPTLDPELSLYRDNFYDRMMSRQTAQQSAHSRVQQVQNDLQKLAALRQNPTGAMPGKPKEKEREPAAAEKLVKDCDVLLAALRYELWQDDVAMIRQAMGDRSREQLYFGGTTSLDDTLDFMLWKHQAKRLGIDYTPADVRKGLNRLIGVGNAFPPEGSLMDNEKAANYLKNHFKNQPELGERELKDLEEALADEFRVQTAQIALLGEPTSLASSVVVTTGIFQPTTGPTPDEFLEYFKEKRTALRVAMLQVPTKNFIGKDEIPPATLELLYNQYHGIEPSPERTDPAFKIPRKLRVEYATGDPEAPVFADQAKILALQPTVLRVSAFASGFPAGGGVGWLGVVGPALTDEPLLEGYTSYVDEQERNARRLEPTATSAAVFDRRFQAAITVGDILGNLQQGSPVAVIGTQVGSDAIYQTAAARAAGTFALVVTDPSAITLGALTRFPAVNTALPFAEVAPEILQKEEKAIARGQAIKTLVNIHKELYAINPGPDAADKAKLSLEEAIKQNRDKTTGKFGIKITDMATPKDRYEMADDPYFKPLNETFGQTLSQIRFYRQFVQNGDPTNDMQKRFRDILNNMIAELSPLQLNLSATSLSDNLLQSSVGTYRPFVLRGMGSTDLYLVWVAEDQPAHEVPLAKAKPEVEAAQRLIDARGKALTYAKTLANQELKDKASTWPQDSEKRASEVNAFLKEKNQGRVFELTNVARLVTPDNMANPGAEKPYYTYSPPADDLPYPSPTLVDSLLAMEHPGDAVVVADRPGKNYYVAVLLDRSVPKLDDFRKVYENAATLSEHDPLYDNFVGQRRQEFAKQFLKRLREEATGDLDKEGRIKIDPEVRGKFDKSGS